MVVLQHREKLAEALVLGLEVSEGQLRVDPVVVAPSDACSFQISGLDEVGDDPLDRAFGHAHPLRDVRHAHARILGDAEQHDEVVGDERPTAVLTRVRGPHAQRIRARGRATGSVGCSDFTGEAP